MKKIFIAILLAISIKGASQPVVGRSGSANTVMDSRWMAQYNMFVPRYADTVSANLQKGIDTCGALIFTYDYNGFWYRQCSPKKWVQIFANSPSPSSDTLVWKMSGNTVGLRQATPVLGTLDNYDLNIMTSGTTTMVVPQGGIIRSSASPNKYLLIDTITRRLHYGDGGSSSTPTWQQTLTAGSTITSDVNITSGTQDINWVGTTGVWDQSMEAFGWTASKSGRNSVLSLTNDSISINPGFGNIHIDTLLNKSNQNALMGWDSTGTDRGQVGYVTLGSGLSLSSGVLNTSGTVPTPISSLTAATGTNSIDNTTFGQSWSWTNLVNTGLSLTSASTAAPAGTSHKILSITASGANATASASTFGVFSANTHTGTNSANYGVYGSSSNGTLNVGTVGISSGGTTSIGGQFSSSGGTTNYGVTGSVTGAATTNYGAEFSASGGTTNNALNIAAGAITLNGSAGTSGQVLTSAGASTLPTWSTPSTVATAVPLSGITAATGSNSINNGSNAQTWNWPTLTNGIGLLLTSLASTTGTTGGSVLTVLRSGSLANASQTTYGAIIQNQHTGTTETNVGLKVEATGADNNYALIVPSGSGNVGIGTTSPSASALLDVTSTTKGVLIPRMTTTERNAISTPAVGLMIYNTTDSAFNYYRLSGWTAIGGGGGGWGTTGTVATLTGASTLAMGTNTFNFSNGLVGIGTTPSKNLHVTGTDGVFLVETNTYNQLSLDNGGWVIGNDGGDGNAEIVGTVSSGTIQYIAGSGGHTFTGNVGIGGSSGSGDLLVGDCAGTGSRAVLAAADGTYSAPVSDRSVKDFIKPLNLGINTVMKLRPVSFEYKNEYKEQYGKGTQIGFIAQDIATVLPNSVYYNTAGLTAGKMGYNEIDLVPLLVKAMQEQQQQIEDLQKEIKKLKRK